MRLQRLLKMSPGELAFRGKQSTTKALSRLTGVGSEVRLSALYGNLSKDPLSRQAHGLWRKGLVDESAGTLLQQFKSTLPTRFFSGVSDSNLMQTLSEHHPDHCAEVIARADAVLAGNFDILGYGQLSFGAPIDWHYDPITGKRTSLSHWSKINPEHESVGEIKAVWELNRHQWILDLGQAYRLTGDERYSRCFVDLVRQWMLQNPPGRGINWTSALEAAIRMVSWCWGLALCCDSKNVTAEFYVTVLNWIRVHACYVERYLSTYYSPNTHLTGEALGLYYVGLLFPELRSAKRWSALASQILVDQLDQQVHSDGVYFEQTACYQYYTTEFYLHFAILANLHKQQLPETVHQRLTRMLDFQLAMRQPNGLLPQFGDSDGGWFVPLSRRLPGDHSGLFATAAAIFERADFAWAATGSTVECAWLLGDPGLEKLQALQPEAPDTVDPQVFAKGGYVVMRNDWSSHAHHMVVDTGPLGCDMSGVHGHADLLSVQCNAFGEPYLVDAGNYCYAVDRSWRDYFRNSWAHSTALVDGCSQARSLGPFAWQIPRPTAHLKHCESNKLWQLVDAQHNGFINLPDPVIHRRRVVFVGCSYWVIVDDFYGAQQHEIELRFQFAAMPVEFQEDGWARATGQQHALVLKSFASVDMDQAIEKGEKEPLRGWISPRYGQLKAAPAVNYNTVAKLPLRIATVIFPLLDQAGPVPAATATLGGGSVLGLHIDADHSDKLYFDDDQITVQRD